MPTLGEIVKFRYQRHRGGPVHEVPAITVKADPATPDLIAFVPPSTAGNLPPNPGPYEGVSFAQVPQSASADPFTWDTLA